MADGRELRFFLRDSAHVDDKILNKTLSKLEEHEVFNIQGLEALASLPDIFDTCGLSTVTRQLIRKALARRGRLETAANCETVACPRRLHGETVRWNDARGFGFVRAKDHESAIFCHHTAIRDGSYLEPGSIVSFVIVETPEPGGTRFRAEQVMLISEGERDQFIEALAEKKPTRRRPRKV